MYPLYIPWNAMGEIKKKLLTDLGLIVDLTSTSKWNKMMHRPFHYLGAQLFRHGIYPITKKGKIAHGRTFFGTEMTLQLPSAMDIYLWGAKTHDSEIRLAKFLIHHLKEGDDFMDVGVHFGFFSLLAAKLVGNKGCVTSIEASPEMFAIFKKNSIKEPCITALNIAAASKEKTIDFFEFPILYSEYNTLFPEQYNEEKWYQKFNARKVSIQALPLDKIIEERHLSPSIIKVDVEGAELEVLQGLEKYLHQGRPLIVMEYLDKESHRAAVSLTESWGYRPYLIDEAGFLTEISDLTVLWKKSNPDSDNIVLKNGY